MADSDAPQSREARTPWLDRWLLDAMRQQGHASVDRLRAAPTAWEALETAGATTEEFARLAAAKGPRIAADLNALGIVLLTLLMIVKPF